MLCGCKSLLLSSAICDSLLWPVTLNGNMTKTAVLVQEPLTDITDISNIVWSLSGPPARRNPFPGSKDCVLPASSYDYIGIANFSAFRSEVITVRMRPPRGTVSALRMSYSINCRQNDPYDPSVCCSWSIQSSFRSNSMISMQQHDRQGNVTYKIVLPDSPHPIIISKNPGFPAFHLAGRKELRFLV